MVDQALPQSVDFDAADRYEYHVAGSSRSRYQTVRSQQTQTRTKPPPDFFASKLLARLSSEFDTCSATKRGCIAIGAVATIEGTTTDQNRAVSAVALTM